ncbi:MAG: hypothetical protein DRQ57_14600 [Gammaproteobacteria bacterium]|nr:MAG: hypothetical protein DRQ57_14600 [Gammaproteobacteria bacterium]
MTQTEKKKSTTQIDNSHQTKAMLKQAQYGLSAHTDIRAGYHYHVLGNVHNHQFLEFDSGGKVEEGKIV